MARKKQEIPYHIAFNISSKYHCVPANREGQEALIRLRGYHKLRGTPLNQCSVNQIHTVAEKILHESYKRVNGISYREAIQVQQCHAAYQEQLYRTFNIPMDDEDPNFVPSSELERMLLD